MTSQSGKAGEEATDEYRNAWASMQMLAEQGQLSWSGREANRVFANLGGGRFADISALTGADWLEDGRACARLDWDEDGRQDLVLRNRNAPRLRLMLNRWPKPGHWLQLDLAGAQCNRDAVGAQVIVEAGGRRLLGSVRAGEGFLACSSKRLHFGLGSATAVDRVIVRWPGGAEETFRSIGADARWRLVQGAGEAQPAAKAPAAALLASRPDPAEAAEVREVTRVPLVSRIPLGPLPLPGWDAPQRSISDLAGAPVLVNFWSTTCAACLEEFEMFQRRRGPLARLGLKVVPMLVEESADPAAARTILAERGLDASAGTADAGLQAAIRTVLEEVLYGEQDVPLPFSLLLDAKGQVCVIYAGAVKFKDLAADLEMLARLPTDAPLDPKLCGGRLLAPVVRDFAGLARKFADLGFDAAAEECARREAAVREMLKN